MASSVTSPSIADLSDIPRPARSDALMETLRQRVVIADGAMGTMLQDAGPTMEDFQHHEGCNEIVNVSRPYIVEAIHHA